MPDRSSNGQLSSSVGTGQIQPSTLAILEKEVLTKLGLWFPNLVEWAQILAGCEMGQPQSWQGGKIHYLHLLKVIPGCVNVILVQDMFCFPG
ncbi:MAG: hypothetical protein HY204_05145 [Nitrospirae bacterium]|nr:hypothetical protein [Nitrospirota bacterium]